jgi:hypothetical protein
MIFDDSIQTGENIQTRTSSKFSIQQMSTLSGISKEEAAYDKKSSKRYPNLPKKSASRSP